MKKILLSLTLGFGALVNAQTLTQSNHAPAVGNYIYATYQCDSTGITPGTGGAGQNWNYSISNLNSLSTFTTSASSNAAFNPADVAVSSAANNTSYYLASAANLKYYGGDLFINNVGITVKYASPAIYAVYPMSLNTTTTSATSGSVSAFSLNGTFTGTCTVTADATGTLTLPARTFTNVIRLNTVQNLNATLPIGAVTVVLNNYDYYEVGSSKTPVFSILTSTISSALGGTSTQTITTVQKDYNLVSVKEIGNDIDMVVFPNPTTSFIDFVTTSKEAAIITIYDINGKMVHTQAMETGAVRFNVEHLSSGNYTYSVANKNKHVLRSGKFIINK